MKIIHIFVTVVAFRPVTNLKVEHATNSELEQPSIFCEAIKSILRKDILKPPLNIQLNDKTFGDCINSINATFLLNICTNTTRWVSQSSLLIIKDEVDITQCCMNYNGHHLVVLQKYSTNTLKDLVNSFWKNLLINVSFMLMVQSEIVIQSFIPYNDGKCNDTELQTINRFDGRYWKTDQFLPKRLRNFHRCPLKITTHNNIAPYIVREEYVSGKRILKGRNIEIITALAASLNFTVDLDYEDSISAWEKCISKIANNEADFFIGNLFLDLPRTTYLDFTVPIFFEVLKFVVPPGRSYTQIENFARAFDIFTWTLITCIFLLMALSVFLLSFQSKKVKIYAFGAGYANASMDFLATIFGNSRTSMPYVNIPRIILLKFILFCFVMRTLYQGSLFNFLQSGDKLKPVQSVDEMITKQYTFFMLKLYDNYLDLKQHKDVR